MQKNVTCPSPKNKINTHLIRKIFFSVIPLFLAGIPTLSFSGKTVDAEITDFSFAKEGKKIVLHWQIKNQTAHGIVAVLCSADGNEFNHLYVEDIPAGKETQKRTYVDTTGGCGAFYKVKFLPLEKPYHSCEKILNINGTR